MPKESVIKTGVDRLVDLIEQNKKISIADAAKQLAVPKSVIEEWASFLEEKEIIETEDKLTSTVLMKKELSKVELTEKRRELEGHKEGFVRKIEATIALIENETTGLSSLREDFQNLGDQIEGQVKKVKTNLDQLERFEDLKRDIDREISQQRGEFHARLDQLNKEIGDKKSRYATIAEQMRKEEEQIEKDLQRTDRLKHTEQEVERRIEALKKAIFAIENGLKEEDEVLTRDEEHLSKLKDDARDIQEDFDGKQKVLQALMKDSIEHENAILAMQQKIIDSLEEQKKQGPEQVSAQSAKKKFEEFFDRKVKVDILVDKINSDVVRIEKDLGALREEALVLDFHSRSKSAKEHVSSLEKKFLDIVKKKSSFESEVMELYRILHKKD
ncbi:MAG: hypothetical protein ABIC95_07410 [archaeon]